MVSLDHARVRLRLLAKLRARLARLEVKTVLGQQVARDQHNVRF